MYYTLLNRIADAGGDSPFYGSAAQELAQDINGLIASRSWCEDDAQVEVLSDYIASQYAEFLRLLNPRLK